MRQRSAVNVQSGLSNSGYAPRLGNTSPEPAKRLPVGVLQFNVECTFRTEFGINSRSAKKLTGVFIFHGNII